MRFPGQDPAILWQVPKDALVSYTPIDPDGLIRAELDGELDLDCADKVRDSLAAAAGQDGCRFLVVDVSGLGFIDSYALGALVSARNTAAGSGVTLTLANPSPPVRKAIEVTGLGDVFGLPSGS
jgi:stage II sporulation protein AA (anti-sigma F factor antagonist)